jgi:hypothetical protein
MAEQQAAAPKVSDAEEDDNEVSNAKEKHCKAVPTPFYQPAAVPYHLIADASLGRHVLNDEEFEESVRKFITLNPDHNEVEATIEIVRAFRQDMLESLALQIKDYLGQFDEENLTEDVERESLHWLRVRYLSVLQTVDQYLESTTEREGYSALMSQARIMLAHECYLAENKHIIRNPYLLTLYRQVHYNLEFIYYHVDKLETNEDSNEV